MRREMLTAAKHEKYNPLYNLNYLTDICSKIHSLKIYQIFIDHKL